MSGGYGVMGSAGEGRELPSLQKYIQYIRDHFGTLPGSASYYSLLEEFLCKGGRAGLQEIKCVELRPLLGDSTNDTPAICPVEFNSRGDEPRVCVLEGFPSPECIAALANRYRVRPELLIGHLDLEHMTTSKHCSQMLPTVPSRRRNIVHIHLITLGRFSPSSISNRTMEELVKKRLIVNEEVNTYQERLFTDRRFGETRYRRVHIHNSQFFSFEQMVSFSVSNTDTMGNTLWNATFLLDQGRDLGRAHRLPWQAANKEGEDEYELLPTVDYNAPAFDQRSLQKLAEIQLGTNRQTFHPIADMVGIPASELSLLCQDPFYLLVRLMQAASLSWAQILNVIEEDISNCRNLPVEGSADSLQQLQFNVGIIDRFMGFLNANFEIIKDRDLTLGTGGHSPQKEQSDTAGLRRDYEYLLKRATMLRKRCEVSSGIVVGIIGVLEAQKSIAQSVQVSQLTALAFLFIPAQFIASVFGMNVKELSQNPRIWTFFAIAIPFTLVSLWTASAIPRARQFRYPTFRLPWKYIHKSRKATLSAV